MEISLKKYGIDFEGSLIDAIRLPLNMIPEKKSGSSGKKISEGRYGRVEEWIESEEYEKISKRSDGNLLAEACLQIAARNCLQVIGQESSISEVKKILRSGQRVTFMMEPFLNVLYLQTALQYLYEDRRMRGKTFDLWFLQIFASICLLLGYLEENIGLNHRDLKGDNILISIRPKTSTHVIPLGDYEWTITMEHEIKLVDFGLGCKGNNMNKPATVNVGPVYSAVDWCPKEGRDLYLLLCYFYAQPIFREMVSTELLEMIETWLSLQDKGLRVKEFLMRHGLERLSWIAFLVNNQKFDCDKCCPIKILEWISTKYPHILKRCIHIK